MDKNPRYILRRFLEILTIFMLFSCSRSSSIIGTWTVEKVTFEFNERKSTPEMIRQLGEIEKHNTLIFKNDSIVHITMAAIDADYKYQISNDGTVTLEPADHPISHIVLNQNVIRTETETVIGKMRVTYKKSKTRR